MSYCPRIIISYDDLHTLEHLITEDNLIYPENKLIEYLYKLLGYDPVEINGTKIIICQPEFTEFNANVREQLDFYGIEYSPDYN